MPEEEPERGNPIGPIEWLRLLPHEAAASSDRLGWVGLQAARCRAAPAFELNLPALTHRRLGLTLAGRQPGPGALERVQGRTASLPGAGAVVAGGGRGVRPRPGAADD